VKLGSKPTARIAVGSSVVVPSRSFLLSELAPCFTGRSVGCGLSWDELRGAAHFQPLVQVHVVAVFDPAFVQSENGLGIWQQAMPRDVRPWMQGSIRGFSMHL
jgi:hypothetical protein